MISRQDRSRITRFRNQRAYNLRQGSNSTSWTSLIFFLVSAFLLLTTLPLASGTITSDPGGTATSVSEDGPVIGIDLGTTYSCVGIFKDGNVEILLNEQGNRITPSYVAILGENERLVGDSAKNQATINPRNTIFDVKRLIGRKFSDGSVQTDMLLFPFTIVGDEGDKPMIEAGGGRYAPEEVSAMILRKMKDIAERSLGKEVRRAVITVPGTSNRLEVHAPPIHNCTTDPKQSSCTTSPARSLPAYFNQQQRLSTKDAGAIAGLEVERIINEPTAAALAYGSGQEHDDATILVYDLGGGTFDVTLLSIDDGAFEVLSTSGDTHLGGEDFDQRIMQYFVNKIEKSGRKVSQVSLALQKLRKEVERVKRYLSSQTQARLEIDDLVPGFDFVDTLTRAKFEELNYDLFQKTLKPVEEVLANSGKRSSDVDRIVLVGGSTRIPKIQSMLSEYFGKPVYTNIDPDEAVAKGAAIQAAILSGQHGGALDELILLDKLSLSMGIETVGGIFTRIVPRDSTLPTTKSQFFSTHLDNQSVVSILVYEGERSMTKDNHLLGKFELSGISPAPRGVPQIEVTFQVDLNNILTVSAVDKGTGKAESVSISSVQGQLSREQIERMTMEADVHAESDRREVDRVQARNEFETFVHTLKRLIDAGSDLGGDMESTSQAEKKVLIEIIEDSLEWIDANPDAEREVYEGKVQAIEGAVGASLRSDVN